MTKTSLLLLYESLNFNYDCIYPYFEENYSGHSDSKYIHTRRLKEDLQQTLIGVDIIIQAYAICEPDAMSPAHHYVDLKVR